MKQIHRYTLLFDFYGPLLTQRQQELVRDYYHNDLSLAEIAESAGVSRQAVHDQIKRAEAALDEYEQRLALLSAHERRRRRLEALAAALAGAGESPAVDQARSLVAELLTHD